MNKLRKQIARRHGDATYRCSVWLLCGASLIGAVIGVGTYLLLEWIL